MVLVLGMGCNGKDDGPGFGPSTSSDDTGSPPAGGSDGGFRNESDDGTNSGTEADPYEGSFEGSVVEADCSDVVTAVMDSNFVDITDEPLGHESFYNDWDALEHEGTECFCSFEYKGDGTGVLIPEYKITGDNSSGNSPFAVVSATDWGGEVVRVGAPTVDAGDHWEATFTNSTPSVAVDPTGIYNIWLSALDIDASSYNTCEDYSLPTWVFLLAENDTTTRPPSIASEEERKCGPGLTTISQFRLGSFPGYWMGTFLFQGGNPDYVGASLSQFQVTQWNDATYVTFRYGTQEVTATPASPTVTFPPNTAWVGNVLLTGDDTVLGTATLNCPTGAVATVSRPKGYLFSMAEVFSALWQGAPPTPLQIQNSPPLVARVFDDSDNPANKWLSVELEGMHKQEMIPMTPLTGNLYRVDFVAEKFEIHGTVEIKAQSLLGHIESGSFRGIGGIVQNLPLNVDFEIQEYPAAQ